MSEHSKRPEADEDALREGYALDLEDDEEDAESVMREAVAAVDARQRERELRDDSRIETAPAADLDSEDVERLQQEVSLLREKALRTLADYENYRRRVEREREEAARYAGSEILREFVAVVDNLERALAASGNVEDLRQGVDMIHRQMIELLRRFGVEPVAAEGRAFDPTVHEAVASQVDDRVEEPRVLQEMQRGYRHHDRLLRPSIVRVAVPPDENGS